MKCPSCGTESDGNFCPSCGTPLTGASCARCSAKLVPGARFCTRCGTATGRTADPHGSNLPWYLGAGVLILLVVILLLPTLTRNDTGNVATSPSAVPSAPVGTGTPPPLTGTPREQADRLFDRIMRAHSAGDTASVAFFSPMGIQAYEAARPLDNDGLFHLALVHSTAGNHDAARATANEILARAPDHLLGLAIAGEAALGAGDEAAAREYFGRYLDVYQTESARNLPEYQDHASVLPGYRTAAQNVTGR